MKYKYLLGVIILIIVVLLLTFIISNNEHQKAIITENQKEVIKIGFIGPLTGNASSYGEYVRKGMELGIEEFNDNNANSFKFEGIYEDGKCTGPDALTAAQKLINVDSVKYIVSFCTGETMAIAPLANENKIIVMASGSTGPEVTYAGDYVFRNISSGANGFNKMVKLMEDTNKNNFVIIAENTEYAKGMSKYIKEKLEDVNKNIVLEEYFAVEDKDFRTLILKAKSQNLQNAIILTQSYNSTSNLFTQMKELDYYPTIYTTEGVLSESALKFYKDNNTIDLLEGAYFVRPSFDVNKTKTKAFFDRFENKYGFRDGPVLVHLTCEYDSVFLIGDAIKAVGNNPEKVKNYFYNLKDWDSTIGTLSFDKYGDAILDFDLYTVENGNLKLVN